MYLFGTLLHTMCVPKECSQYSILTRNLSQTKKITLVVFDKEVFKKILFYLWIVEVKSIRYVQLQKMNVILQVNKPYVNEITLNKQNL